jgi:carbon monoxide dehydrogenase subunit G
MIETRADVTLPVAPDVVFAAVADLEHADWLPAVRGLRHIGGPRQGVGARYEVEAGLVGRHLRGILVCRELTPPQRVVMVLEQGLDLTVTVTVRPVSGGSNVEIAARYSVGGGPLAAAVERASQGAARRETARACEQLAARFGRKGRSEQTA